MKMNYFALEFQTLLALLLITIIIIFFLRWRIIYNSKAKERLLVIEKDYDVTHIVTVSVTVRMSHSRQEFQLI